MSGMLLQYTGGEDDESSDDGGMLCKLKTSYVHIQRVKDIMPLY